MNHLYLCRQFKIHYLASLRMLQHKHPPHAAAESPGCATAAPVRHWRSTAPVRSSAAAPGRCPPARRKRRLYRGCHSLPAGRGSRCDLLRRQTAVSLAGIAAEAEGLQVAEVVRAALVPGHDGLHLRGPVVLMGPAALAAAPGASVNPVLDRAAGGMRWQHSCSTSSRSLSLSSSPPIRE